MINFPRESCCSLFDAIAALHGVYYGVGGNSSWLFCHRWEAVEVAEAASRLSAGVGGGHGGGYLGIGGVVAEVVVGGRR